VLRRGPELLPERVLLQVRVPVRGGCFGLRRFSRGSLLCRSFLGRGLGGGCFGGGSSGPGADDGQDGTDLCGFVFVDADLLQRAGNGGRDFGVHLVGGYFQEGLVYLYGIAHGLQPAGDGAFGDAFTQGREGDLVAFAAAGCRCLCRGCCRCRLGRSFLGRCFFGRCGSGSFLCRCRLGRSFFGGCSGGGAAAGAVTDADQGSAHLGGLVLGDQDFLNHAGDRRGDFSVYFVGGDLEQRLVHLYPVTYLLEPAGDGSFGDALTEGGQVNGFRHVVPVLLIDL
jgi:hypothetical protein